MFYPQSVLDDIISGNDIVEVINSYVTLTQKGSNYFGLCPFHKENTPSFSVSSDKQLYHCFGCGASGNVVSFIMQRENYDFKDSIAFLADRINYTLPEVDYSGEAAKLRQEREILYDLHKKAALHYYDILQSEQGAKAKKYLEGRMIKPNIINNFALGYSLFRRDDLYRYLISEGYDLDIMLKSGLVMKSKSGEYYDRFFNRLMFPIIDHRDRVIGFGGRVIGDGEPKYLNSPETSIFNKSRNLYGLNRARHSKTRTFILVEGYMDVISLHQAGFKNSVAALGTAFNENHARTLKKFADNVVLLFDSDEAGVKAVLRAIPVLVENGIKVRVLQVTDAKDPDEYIKKFGADAFSKLLQGAKSHITFQIEQIRNKYNLENIDDKISFTTEASKVLASVTNEIERDVYVKEVAEITDVSIGAIEKEIGKILGKPMKVNNKPIVNKVQVGKKGVEEAKKSLLNIVVNKPKYAQLIMDNLSNEEFVDETYIRFLDILKDYISQGKNIYPAEIVNHFTTGEEQQIISQIFFEKYEDETDIIKIINDNVKIIKNSYIDGIISKCDDVNKLQEALKYKKSLNDLNITL